MKQTLKKSLAIVLATLMFLTAAPLSGFAGLQLPDLNLPQIDFGNIFNATADAADTIASGTCGENLTWTLDSDGTLTISGKGQMTGYSLSSAPWDANRASVKTVVIADGVTRIDYSVFYACTSLAIITVDSANRYYSNDEYGVLFNKDKTFLQQYPIGNARTSYTIPDSVKNIGSYAFYNCNSLASITIPDSVTSIGDRAFYNCNSLASITIPDSVTSIGDRAFAYCDSLASITVETDNAKYSSDAYGVLFNNDKTALIQYPAGNARTSYTIPDSVKNIGSYAFYSCDSLASITIPDSVKNIGSYAFYSCDSLASITIPDSVTYIGSYAFYNCDSLASITIPDSVTYIGSYAFYNCDSLAEITILNPACEIDSKYTIPTAVVLLGYDNSTAQAYAEEYDRGFVSLSGDSTDIILSGDIGENADYTITRDGKMTITGSGDMYDYGSRSKRPWHKYCRFVKSVSIADSITSISDDAFYDCTILPSVTFGENSQLTSIGNSAFYNCNSLASITIPDSVTSIGNHAFDSCDSLISVTIPDSVTSIGSYAFSGCDNLSSVTFGKISRLTHIYDGAFQFCISLANITIPGGVIHIGSAVFYNCVNLEKITVDSANRYYSNDEYGVLFRSGKTFLKQYPIGNTRKEYIIPNSVTDIGSYAFASCDSLASITIPDSVTNIGSNAFFNCKSLANITIPDSVTYIEHAAFASCDSLACITFGNNSQLTYIGNFAFAWCTALEKIVIPEKVTDIYDSAFEDCNKLAAIFILNRNCTIQNNYNNSATIPLDTIIHGFKDSKAQSYANTYARTFHELVKIDKLAPTCTENGLENHFSCPACNIEFTQDAIIAALGHNYQATITKEPTCTEKGVITYTCKNDKTHTYTEDLAIIEHSIVTVPAKAATCEKIGWEAYEYCTGCNYTTYKELAKTGHTYTCSSTKESTCTEPGVKTYTCQNDASHTYTEEIPAPGHIPGTAATCTEDQVCTVCGEALADKRGHAWDDGVVTTLPTCTEKGEIIYTCAACGYKLAKIISQLDHTPGATIMEDKVDAACTVDGSYNMVVYCATCGEKLSTTPYTITAPGHTPGADATCTEDQICTVCGEVLADKRGHDYESVVTAPTCTEDGYTTYTCTACGDSYVADETSAFGHTWGDWTVTTPATIENEGEEIRVCTACGEEESRPIEKLPLPTELIIYKPYTIAKETADGYAVVTVGTTVAELLAVSNGTDVLNANGEKVSSETVLATGMQLVIMNGDTVVDSMEIAVLGDVNGDGEISTSDARTVLRMAVNLESLDGVYLTAAKVTAAEQITTAHARSILRASVGLEEPINWINNYAA